MGFLHSPFSLIHSKMNVTIEFTRSHYKKEYQYLIIAFEKLIEIYHSHIFYVSYHILSLNLPDDVSIHDFSETVATFSYMFVFHVWYVVEVTISFYKSIH